VNKLGSSVEDVDGLSQIQPEGYVIPNYNVKHLRWNEVLVESVSQVWQWCTLDTFSSEGAWQLASGNLSSLSEQQLVDWLDGQGLPVR